MEPQHIKALVKKVGKKAGMLTGVIGSTADPDRYGDIVNQESWLLDDYKANPVILWAHNAHFVEDRPPIGKAVRVEVKDGNLEFDIQFDMKDPFAADIFRKYSEGYLNAFSVGFIPHERANSDDGKTILINNELLELSAVPVPANPKALNQLRTLSFAAYKDWDSFVESGGRCQKAAPDGDEPENEEPVDNDDPVEENTPDTEKSISEADAMKIAKSAIEILTFKGIIPANSESESTEGDEASETNRSSSPENPQLGATPKFVAVIRETTKQMQGLLAEYNRQQKAK